MKEKLHNDWHFLLIAITTLLAGINFIINPNLMQDRSAYAFIVNRLDDAVFSVPMFLLGAIGCVLFFMCKKQFRTPFLVSYQFIWMILMVAYIWRAFSGFPNTTWVLAFCFNTLIFLSALRGDE